jgi:hypothetical protein
MIRNSLKSKETVGGIKKELNSSILRLGKAVDAGKMMKLLEHVPTAATGCYS